MEMMRELSSVGDGIQPYLSRLRYCISPLARIIFVPFLDPESDHNEAEDYISNRPHVRRCHKSKLELETSAPSFYDSH